MNVKEEAFQTYAALQGFDIQGFDKWLPTLQGTGAYSELIERRNEAIAAMKDEQKFLRHLEWMLVRWKWINRVDALAPMASLGKKFQGKGKGKSPLRKKIEQHIKKNPDAKNLGIWDALKAKPPKGWVFQDNRQGIYVEIDNQNLNYKSFQSLVSKVRNELKT